MKLYKVTCFRKFNQSVLIRADSYGDALELGVEKLFDVHGADDDCYLVRLESDCVEDIPIAASK